MIIINLAFTRRGIMEILPEPTTPIEFFLSIRTILLITFTILLLFGFIYLFVKARSVEFITTKRIIQGYGLFALCFALTRIFFLISSLDNVLAYPEDGPMSAFWALWGYTVTMASLVFVFLVVEKYILQRKLIFTIVAVISLCADIFAIVLVLLGIDLGPVPANDIALYVQYVAAPILGIAICVLYLVIIKNAAGDVRKTAIYTFIGILLILVGIILDIAALAPLDIFSIRGLLNPIFFIAGGLVVLYSLRRTVITSKATSS